jgi:peptide deformylase
MILEIVQLGDPVLREDCAPIATIDDSIVSLAEDMIETMYHAHGIGLAAPQIGKALRMAVIDVSHDPRCVSFFSYNGEECDMLDHMPLVFLNPELELSGNKSVETEGCLSILGVRAPVARPSSCRVTFTDIEGETATIETDGLLCRAFQHEIDHLNGVIFLDRLSPASRMAIRKQLTKAGHRESR